MQSSSNKINKRKLGNMYEQAAARYLSASGLLVVTMNYRCKAGEIDIIARDGDTLVFAEVKYRKNRRGGGALAAVTRAKQKTICRAAAWYLLSRGLYPDCPCRFDVIGITDHDITWSRGAFAYQNSW